MDIIRIKNVKTIDNRITCDIISEGEVSRAFKKENVEFTYESSIDLTGLPESIAVLPAIGTVLPLAWLFDARLIVDRCDADFVRSIPAVKKGYMDMYPGLSFGGEFIVGEKYENPVPDEHKAMALFSGGLDSHDTAIRHADEKPDLLILRGADISILEKDDPGWEEILRQVDHLADALGVSRISVVTNFRRIEDYRFLNKWTTDVAGANGSYWYCFQHGIAMLTHAAPIAWKKGIGRIYIASSFTEGDEGGTACASDPSIDNNLHFCSAEIAHDGFQYDRNKKLMHVAKWVQETGNEVYLRVCHARLANGLKDGKNCCKCEKCYRTILGLFAIKEDPNRYGFDIGDFDEFAETMHKRAYKIVRHFNTRYVPIIRLMRENYTEEEIPDSMRWLYDFRFDEKSEYFKWVDKVIATEYEKNVSAVAELNKKERTEIKLREKLRECRKELKELKTGKLSGRNGGGSLLSKIRNAFTK